MDMLPIFPSSGFCRLGFRSVIFLLSGILIEGQAAAPLPNDISNDPSANRNPNVIFILAGGLSREHLGCYGAQGNPTPNIDQMAKEGLLFTEAYIPDPSPTVSNLILLTGVSKTGVSKNRKDGNPLPATKSRSLAHQLKKSGYSRSAYLGLWRLGKSGEESPMSYGFDDFIGFKDPLSAGLEFPTQLWRNNRTFKLHQNANGTRAWSVHDQFLKTIYNFIRIYREQPFLLVYNSTSLTSTDSLPSIAGAAGNEKIQTSAARLDQDVGRILDYLKGFEIEKDTLIFLLSDSPQLGISKQGSRSGHRLSSGNEWLLWEHYLQIPAIAWSPGTVPSGISCSIPWSLSDILPTFSDLTGFDKPSDFKGISLLPAIRGKDQAVDRTLNWEVHYNTKTHTAVRLGRWKAVRTGESFPWILYDLESEFPESENVAHLHSEIIRKIEDLWSERSKATD
jgi:arylsulfatase A-like enzyme